MWEKFGDELPKLQEVALRLLPCHATSASTERNWSLWGRIYSSARSCLGMNNAKAMITICAAEKSKVSERDAMALTLDVIEGDV